MLREKQVEHRGFMGSENTLYGKKILCMIL